MAQPTKIGEKTSFKPVTLSPKSAVDPKTKKYRAVFVDSTGTSFNKTFESKAQAEALLGQKIALVAVERTSQTTKDPVTGQFVKFIAWAFNGLYDEHLEVVRDNAMATEEVQGQLVIINAQTELYKAQAAVRNNAAAAAASF